MAGTGLDPAAATLPCCPPATYTAQIDTATAGVASFRYTSVTGSRDWNTNTYSSGPTNPFGTVTTDAEETSLYATYTPE